jgi:hypothetical protein
MYGTTELSIQNEIDTNSFLHYFLLISNLLAGVFKQF